MRRVLTLGTLALAALCLSGCCCDSGRNAHNAWLYESDDREGRTEPSTCETLDTYFDSGRGH